MPIALALTRELTMAVYNEEPITLIRKKVDNENLLFGVRE